MDRSAKYPRAWTWTSPTLISVMVRIIWSTIPSERAEVNIITAVEATTAARVMAVRRELRQRFRQASDHCAQAVRREREDAARRGWNDLFAAAAQVRAYAVASAQGAPAEECEALRSAAAATVADLAHAPKGTRALLEQQLDGIAAGRVSTDLAANEAALRLLCIRAELIADRETPPEDLERRRDYQMQRLVAAMGKGERPTPADLDELSREWLAVGPVEATVHDALFARFQRCRGDGRHRA